MGSDTEPHEARQGSDDARFAIGQFSSWIMNADTKAALLLTGLTVLTLTVIGQHGRFGNFPPQGTRAWVAIAFIAVAGIAAGGAGVCLLSVIRPKIRPTTFSRFSWPSVANVSVYELVGGGQLTERQEAWATAHALANIASRKFRSLRTALIWWALAVASLVMAILVAPRAM